MAATSTLQRVKAEWNSDFRFGGKSTAASKSLLFSFVLDPFQAISVIFLTVETHEAEYQTSGCVGEQNLWFLHVTQWNLPAISRRFTQ